MQLSTKDHGEIRIVKVGEQRIDAAIAIQFKEAVRNSAGDTTERLVLDLSDVSFLDSSGLGSLVAAMKLLGPKCTLELAALTSNVERVFRLTRMNTVFTIHASAEDALGGSAPLADVG